MTLALAARVVAAHDDGGWPIGPAGIAFLLLHGIVMPVAVLKARKKLEPGAPLHPKTRQFAITILELTLFATVSVVVARIEWLAPLFPRYEFRSFHVALAILALALFVGFMRPRWRKAVERDQPVLHFFSPETGSQRLLWVGVCCAAGVGEEITYRGVLTGLLANVSGSLAVAVLASAVLFGLAHTIQGWRSAAVIVGFALVFQGLVLAAGSLYVAMAVHVAYDLIAGLTYGKLVREKRSRAAADALTSAAT